MEEQKDNSRWNRFITRIIEFIKTEDHVWIKLQIFRSFFVFAVLLTEKFNVVDFLLVVFFVVTVTLMVDAFFGVWALVKKIFLCVAIAALVAIAIERKEKHVNDADKQL